MKFCKDCKFCEPNKDCSRTRQENLELAKCTFKPKTDSQAKMLVTGLSSSLEYYYCSTERGGTESSYCGPDAINFSPKNEILPDTNPTA